MSAPTRDRANPSRRRSTTGRSKGEASRTGSRSSSPKKRTRSEPGTGRVTAFVGGPVLDLSEPFADDAAPKGRRLLGAKPPGRRSKSFVTILSLIMVLNLVGLAMILSASSVTSLEDHGSPWYQFTRQFIWLSVGSVAMVLTMRRDYRRWRNRSGYLLLGVLAMLFLVLVPHVGVKSNGATRWLGVGQFTIQPSEFAKLALIIFWADLLSRRAKWMDDARLTVFPVMLTFGVTAALIMLQPNLGTTTIIFFIMLGMLFVGGAPSWVWASSPARGSPCCSPGGSAASPPSWTRGRTRRASATSRSRRRPRSPPVG
jgi:cell division protein FtsW